MSNAILFPIIIFILCIIIFVIYSLSTHYKSEANKLKSQKQSQSTTYGKTMEQLIPFSKHYPYLSKHFRFLGSPIDGIQFNDNEIIFIEFKGNKSRMSSKQKNIKKLIEDGKVKFKEIRF